MKQLVCAKDIENLHAAGKKVFYIKEKSIITPSARDAAEAYGITFCTKEESQEPLSIPGFEGMDQEKLFKIMSLMMESSLIREILKPYKAQRHENGLKLVDGSSVKMEALNQGNPSQKVSKQELVGEEESSLRAGLIEIEASSYEEETKEDKVLYLIEGTLKLRIDQKDYEAQAGDTIFVPAESKLLWQSEGKSKLFYSNQSKNQPKK